jgi:hypothetical protein
MNIEGIISQRVVVYESFIEGLLSGLAILCKRLLGDILSEAKDDIVGFVCL